MEPLPQSTVQWRIYVKLELTQWRQTHCGGGTSGQSRTRNAWFTSSLKPWGCPSGTRSCQARMRAQWCRKRYLKPRGVSRFFTPLFTAIRRRCFLSRSPSICLVCDGVAAIEEVHCLTISRMYVRWDCCCWQEEIETAMSMGAHFSTQQNTI